MDTKQLKTYADIIVAFGVNLYRGQSLGISTGKDNYDFALMIAEAAYRRGAKYVDIVCGSNELMKYRLAHSKDEDLDYVPSFRVARSNEALAYDWASVSIDNTEELDVLHGTDPARLQRVTKAASTALKRRSEELMMNKHPWCVVAAPGPKWGAKVFGCRADGKAAEKMWDALVPVLRLDTPDPMAAWQAHVKTLADRSRILNDLVLDNLVFTGPGTELTVGLNPVSLWAGGLAQLPDGRLFLPNIPTEEVFTTPDFRRTEGKVKATRPVEVMQNIVEGAWFEFKDGSVVNAGADKGGEVLEQYLNVDDGARCLGEISLVDGESPIYKSGLMFNSILYDENAASHMALGAGYPDAMSNAHQLNTDDDKKAAGCNVSLVHTDFMIGSPDVDVTGIGADGKETKLMEKGTFLI